MKTKIALAAFLLSASSALASPQYANLPPDLAQAARNYDTAQIKGDGAALNRLLADDYALLSSHGQNFTKLAFIADLTAPGGAQPDFTLENPIEKVWRNGAVLGGTVHETITQDGKPAAITMQFADVWAKRGGKWQVVFTQVTRLPK